MKLYPYGKTKVLQNIVSNKKKKKNKNKNKQNNFCRLY